MSAKTDVRTSGSRDSLRYLDRVGLEVEPLPHALQEEGLTREHLFSFVRERLERAPVQVLSRTSALHLKGAPTLFLQVSMSEQENGSFLSVVALELVQGATLERLSDPGRFFAAPTWRALAVGCVGTGQLSLLLDPIGSLADAFVETSQ